MSDIEKHVDADLGWTRDLQHIMNYGIDSSPRGMPIKECIGFVSVVSMQNPIITNPMRKLGYKFMAAEAAWILSGMNDVKSIAPYSKQISKFSDDGVSFFGAYGPPLEEQFAYVVRCLYEDPDSRQAVATIWRQNPPRTKDVPCTVSLQFLVRYGKIYCVANMRSSDLWLGHPYDIFNFSMFALMVAVELNNCRKNDDELPVHMGELYLFCGSKHLYERDFKGVEDVLKCGDYEFDRKVVFDPENFSSINELKSHLWDAANSEKGALTLLGG